LILAHILRIAVALHLLVHVLTDRLGAVLLVQILEVHAVHWLRRAAGGHLELAHLGRVHLGVVGIEGTREVADHLLAHAAGCLSVRLLAILGHYDILIHVWGRSTRSQVNRMVCLLARRTLYYVAAEVELFLGA